MKNTVEWSFKWPYLCERIFFPPSIYGTYDVQFCCSVLSPVYRCLAKIICSLPVCLVAIQSYDRSPFESQMTVKSVKYDGWCSQCCDHLSQKQMQYSRNTWTGWWCKKGRGCVHSWYVFPASSHLSVNIYGKSYAAVYICSSIMHDQFTLSRYRWSEEEGERKMKKMEIYQSCKLIESISILAGIIRILEMWPHLYVYS